MKKLLLSIALVTMGGTLWGMAAPTVINSKTPAKSTASEQAAGALYLPFDYGDGLLSASLGATTLVTDMVVSLDGNYIYVCGSRGSTPVMMVARFTRNSTSGAWQLDTNWDSAGNGYVTPSIVSGAASVANAMAIPTSLDANGVLVEEDAIYLCGQGIISTAGMVVVKLNKADGSLDTSFNTDSTDGGVLAGYGTSAIGYGITVDDTYIYAVGKDGSGNFAVMKLNKVTGDLDAAFNGDSGTGGMDGELTINASGSGSNIAYDVVKDDSENALYIVGDANSTFGTVKMSAVNGKLYTAANGFTAFSTDGIIASGAGVAKAATCDDSYLYLAGRDTGSTAGIVKKYLKTTGALDDNFGTSGSYSTALIDKFEDVKLLGGKLYLTGLDGAIGIIARMTTTGSAPLDTTFNTNGYNVTAATNMTLGGFAVGFLPINNYIIVIAGSSSGGNNVDLAAFSNNVDPIQAAVLGLSGSLLGQGLVSSAS